MAPYRGRAGITAASLPLLLLAAALLLLPVAHAFFGDEKVPTEVFLPPRPLTARIWTNVTDPAFVYPELSATEFGDAALKAKPSFGVSLSGGGFRATSVGVGWLRGLHLTGYLAKARYLSSNSGGSWVNGAMSYTQVPLQQFFGPYISPENLTEAASKELPAGSYDAAIATADPFLTIAVGAISDSLSDDDPKVRAWSRAVGQSFLDPFGDGAHSSSFTTLGVVANVTDRVTGQLPEIPFYAAEATADRPFPIILSSLILSNESNCFFPFEWTPLYIGAPILNTSTTPVVGGGFVEPIGFNSKPPPATKANSLDGAQAVQVNVSFVVPLADAVGVSSSFIAEKARGGTTENQDALAVERFEYWNLHDLDGTSALLPFGDGGGHDNVAITPLLRRKVQHIVALVATVLRPSNATEWAKGQYDISGLFGAIPADTPPIDGVPSKLYNKNLKVFDKAGYAPLYDSFEGCVANGTVNFHRAQYKVLDNPALNVHGGWEVDVLWVMNAQATDWEEALPKDLQEQLAKDRKSKLVGFGESVNPTDADSLRDFPYISVFALDYSKQLTTMMTQLSSWGIYQLQDELASMVA